MIDYICRNCSKPIDKEEDSYIHFKHPNILFHEACFEAMNAADFADRMGYERVWNR